MPEPEPTVAPAAAQAPATGEQLAKENAELHLFDIVSGTFVIQDPDVTASVLDIGDWECKYQIEVIYQHRAKLILTYRLAAS